MDNIIKPIKKINFSIKRKIYLFLVNKIYVGTNPIFFDKKRKLLNSIGYSIGKNTKIVGPIEWTCEVSIGDNCWVGKNMIAHGNGRIEIGDNCDIAPHVMFLTGNHKIGDSYRRAGTGENHIITVGNGVWIGARSTIVNNIKIGNSSVIAACACVTKDVEKNTLIGGVPAKVIRELKND